MAVRAHAEVLDGLPGVLGATEEERVGTGRGTQSELVQSQGFTTSLLDSGSGGRGEAESSNRQLGNGQEAVVIGDSADNDNSLALLGIADIRDDLGEGDRGTVDSRHEQAAQNNLVEVGLGTTCTAPTSSDFRNPFFCILVDIADTLFRNCVLDSVLALGGDLRTCEEAVQLHQDLQIDVLALRRLAVRGAHMVTVQVDTCNSSTVSVRVFK